MPKPEIVDQVGGVVPGYTGYVPTSKHTHGISHYGNLAGGHRHDNSVGSTSGGRRGKSNMSSMGLAPRAHLPGTRTRNYG